ncbi:MAG: hypothetical protein JRF63_07495 [Deltaproteobacteria bacterium]|nr:hypothetical protein [Deltaproteobacteria bacterium]
MNNHYCPAFFGVLLAVGLLGCRDAAVGPVTAEGDAREKEQQPDPEPAKSPTLAGVASASAESAIASKPDQPGALDGETQKLLEHLTGARAVRARPISKRSLSLKLSLRDGRDAAFKPLLSEKRTARYEVAAFRVSRLLGLSFVPPSTMRRIPLDNFAWMLGEEHSEINEALRKEAHLDDRSGVWGAAIVWVDGLEPSGLEGSAGLERLGQLLALDGPSVDQEPLVVEASALLVFDYVTGNWDRFSGGNLFRDADGGQLVLLDNNGAFGRWSEIKQERMDGLLQRAFRFSRRLIASLRALNSSEIERALERDPWHQTRRLLTRRERELVLARRDAVLSHVDALLAEYGAERVLVFP